MAIRSALQNVSIFREIAVTDGELNDNGHNLMVDWPKGKAQTSNHVNYVCL